MTIRISEAACDVLLWIYCGGSIALIVAVWAWLWKTRKAL